MRKERKALPLFFDETFVHWDLDRFRRGAEIIREIGKMRQVFFFTCREELAPDNGRCCWNRSDPSLISLPQ